MLHGFMHVVQALGAVLVVVGGVRIVRAPAQAARRGSGTGELIALDGRRLTPGLADADGRGRYERGLIDFYRISGTLAVLAGILLILVPLFAG